VVASLDGADEHAHRNREHCWQDPSQQEHRPPSGGEAGVRLWEDAEELPFLALGQWLEHDRILPQNLCAHGLRRPHADERLQRITTNSAINPRL
jgi:hypothetical protein